MQPKTEETQAILTSPPKTAWAVFAGGCFWCTESDFEKIDGVIDAVSGYTGGTLANPTYEAVSAGGTGHVEAVKVIYDPARVTYEQLLEVFWRSVDPTDGGGQFVDRGPQYRSAVFYANAREKQQAETTKARLAAGGVYQKPIATEILPLGEFHEAEGYHQDYYRKNPQRYKMYRSGSGRDRFLSQLWAGRPLSSEPPPAVDNETQPPVWRPAEFVVPDEDALRQRLTPLQYKTVRNEGTEPPFKNEFWDHHEAGLYVDIVSGEPLFSSTHKFDSGTGWPSFSQPVAPANVLQREDRSMFMVRVEVRSKHADSHLGHVFNDGPAPTGMRYCINSAALAFVPKAQLQERGYGKYVNLFE